MNAHNLSCIHPDAKIGKNVTIQPFVIIEADVVIGDNSWIGSHACVMNGTRIGKNCRIFQGAIVGSVPQDLKFEGEQTTLEIEDNVIIREYCTVNRGTKAGYKTLIKKNTMLMAYVHIAHDCIIGENCILANGVNVAGHVEIGNFAILGGLTAVHQFVKIGQHVMVGGGSLVGKDIPPYIKVARNPLAYAGVNTIGLKRRGFSQELIHQIQDAYRILFVKGYNVRKAVEHITNEVNESTERTIILNFIQSSERGMVKSFRQINGR